MLEKVALLTVPCRMPPMEMPCPPMHETLRTITLPPRHISCPASPLTHSGANSLMGTTLTQSSPLDTYELVNDWSCPP
jgi:hypothetical protein